MTQWLKQLTAGTVYLGPFVDDTDGKTAEDALTISQGDILLSKAGAAFAQISGTANATHGTLGYYAVTIGTADVDTLGALKFAVHESGALPVWESYMVVPANTWDSLIGGTDYLDVTAVGTVTANAIAGTVDAVTSPVTVSGGTITSFSGTVSANMVQVSGSATAADNMEQSMLAVVLGSAVTGTLTTSRMSTNLTEATDNHYNGRVIIWTSGALAGQASAITAYDGVNKILTYQTVTDAPSNADTFVLV